MINEKWTTTANVCLEEQEVARLLLDFRSKYELAVIAIRMRVAAQVNKTKADFLLILLLIVAAFAMAGCSVDADTSTLDSEISGIVPIGEDVTAHIAILTEEIQELRIANAQLAEAILVTQNPW